MSLKIFKDKAVDALRPKELEEGLEAEGTKERPKMIERLADLQKARDTMDALQDGKAYLTKAEHTVHSDHSDGHFNHGNHGDHSQHNEHNKPHDIL